MEDQDLSDAAEFVEQASGFKEQRAYGKQLSPASGIDKTEDEKEKKASDGVSQYALMGGGYFPTSSTVKTLPPGCYDINASQKGPYAAPALPPSGLLLELPEMRSEYVVDLVENFWESEKDYKFGNKFVIGGAAYKAGVMLYGPPGTGKSCTIKIVSKKLVERGGTVFYASIHPEVVMEFLQSFSRIERNRKCIVILEDLDSLIGRFGESSYLEMLDSAKTIDNVLFVATTNYPDRLDPRIYNRPGRFSHMVKIGLPTAAARTAYLKAILKDHRDVPYIVENSEDFTIDHLTATINAVYREKKDLAKEIKRLRTLFVQPKADSRQIGFGLNSGGGEVIGDDSGGNMSWPDEKKEDRRVGIGSGGG